MVSTRPLRRVSPLRPFAALIFATLVPYFLDSPQSVSEVFTVCFLAGAGFGLAATVLALGLDLLAVDLVVVDFGLALVATVLGLVLVFFTVLDELLELAVLVVTGAEGALSWANLWVGACW
jgi:hypothetical protein